MKRLIIASVIGLFFAQCSNAGSNQTKAKTEQKATTAVKHIGKAEFLTQVFDYQKNPQTVVYLGKKPAIVDFYANWCGPCRQLSPLLEELANEYKDKIVVYKIDTDKEKEIAQDLGIQALPTLIFFPLKGKPMMIQGYRTKEDLKKIITEELLK